jgi:hypothetical protein
MIIETNTYEINMVNGVRYRVICGESEIDDLIELIGEDNIVDVDTL